jgi:hypothetical protein
VVRRLAEELESGRRPLVGVTSLALGADQLFAESVLSADGELEVVVPSEDYETTFRSHDLLIYRRLLERARSRRILPFDKPSEEAFMAAGHVVVDLSDTLIAVWDGRPSHGLGGTADTVKYARTLGRPVTVIWPEWAGAH